MPVPVPPTATSPPLASTPPLPARPAWQALLVTTIAFVGIVFVVVWQSFGLAGYGRDFHWNRFKYVVLVLLVCGYGFALSRRRVWRIVACAVGIACATYLWWTVPSDIYKGSVSLGNAAEMREKLLRDRSLHILRQSEIYADYSNEYPSLFRNVKDVYPSVDEIVKEMNAKFDATPLDDLNGFLEAEREANEAITSAPRFRSRFDTGKVKWLRGAVHSANDKLGKVPLGDWLTFSHTAIARQELADVILDPKKALKQEEREWVLLIFELRDALRKAEAGWVNSTVERLIAEQQTSKLPLSRNYWREVNEHILALKAVTEGDRRFADARTRLFSAAHDAAKLQIAKLFQQGQFDLAYGIARAHAVEWDATAAISDRQAELHSLRLVCQYLAHIYSDLTPPPDAEVIAPPPRAKPEKQP